MPSRPPKQYKSNAKGRKNIVLYPHSHDIPTLSKDALALKIARHSRCPKCEDCVGLRPRLGVTVVLDSEFQKGASPQPSYISHCQCGHSVTEHALCEEVSSAEFKRRGRVAVRLDELLEDKHKLLDFDYENEDIISLRKQIVPLDEGLSPLSDNSLSSNPPLSRKHARPSSSTPKLSNKKRRLSNTDTHSSSEYSSPLSNPDGGSHDGEKEEQDEEAEAEDDSEEDDEDSKSLIHTTLPGVKPGDEKDHEEEDSDSDEEEQPLALTNGPKSHIQSPVSRYNGKKTAGQMTVVGAAPTARTTGEFVKNATETRPKIKPEELNEKDIQRLVTGVTVDTEDVTIQSKLVKQSHLQSQAGLVGIVSLPPCHPDLPSRRHLVLLTNLKSLFQRQLPKMPREYITRLVFDKNSHCMAIIKRGLKVVGGICYRVFEQRGFAEIVFLATNSVAQDKGYGSMLMNNFKMHIKKTYPTIMHFLTYADNYAVGYFRKQGFSKEITLDRSIWAGYFKDYEGATIMQCTMLRKVDYLQMRDMLSKQREAVLTKIRGMSKSHKVYSPLPQFLKAKQDEEVTVDWQVVPGLCDSGWTPSMAEMSRNMSKDPQNTAMAKWLTELQNHSAAWPFMHPVKAEEVADYYDVIKNPMDFTTMENKLERRMYPDIDSFVADANLVFNNCYLYNPEDSIYVKSARKLAKFFKDMVAGDKKLMKLKE